MVAPVTQLVLLKKTACVTYDNFKQRCHKKTIQFTEIIFKGILPSYWNEFGLGIKDTHSDQSHFGAYYVPKGAKGRFIDNLDSSNGEDNTRGINACTQNIAHPLNVLAASR